MLSLLIMPSRTQLHKSWEVQFNLGLSSSQAYCTDRSGEDFPQKQYSKKNTDDLNEENQDLILVKVPFVYHKLQRNDVEFIGYDSLKNELTLEYKSSLKD
jgi:hypothetical protein